MLAGWGIADVAMPQPVPQLLSYVIHDPGHGGQAFKLRASPLDVRTPNSD